MSDLTRAYRIPTTTLGITGATSSRKGKLGCRPTSSMLRFVGSSRSGFFACLVLAGIWLLYFIFFQGTPGDLPSKEAFNRVPEPPLPIRPLPSPSFLDPPLPPDHPCQTFTLPPPPADKKRTGPRPCPVCYLPLEEAVQLHPYRGVFPPLVLKNLTYISGVPRPAAPRAGSDFGGYPTLEERKKSFVINESMNIYCGFAQGVRPGVGSGFDVDEWDLRDMNKCKDIVVVSAIFDNYDPMQQPKNISEKSIRDVCFFMFVDEKTADAIDKDEVYQQTRKVGLWRVVTVRNIPYTDARRTGKIPKLLTHRLFPNARFSLWIDGKLELTVDPYQVLERFLWRSHDTFAISKHYKRFDVFVEAEANKAAKKYDNASIDAQVEVYRSEGLVPYTSAKLPIISDVPEGCVIIREHTPISSLFTCLWFNEVDRFTSRDQISFGVVRDKIRSQVPWRVNMFLDCERRNFVVQGYHRDVLMAKKAGMPNPPAVLVRSPKARKFRKGVPLRS